MPRIRQYKADGDYTSVEWNPEGFEVAKFEIKPVTQAQREFVKERGHQRLRLYVRGEEQIGQFQGRGELFYAIYDKHLPDHLADLIEYEELYETPLRKPKLQPLDEEEAEAVEAEEEFDA